MEGLASNAPDYGSMEQPFAGLTLQPLPALHDDLARLGAIRSLKFIDVGPQGGDRYDFTFVSGVRRVAVNLDADGKILGANLNMPRSGPPS